MGKVREIIIIDEEKCNGCGQCVPNCPEGAIQMIDGKARLISDLFCDGLGACIGHCPQEAISIEKRNAEQYDERRVMENIIKQGPNVIKAHLSHLKDHGQTEYLKTAEDFLKEKKIPSGFASKKHSIPCGCPGARTMDFTAEDGPPDVQQNATVKSQLRQWPVQLHLVNPAAPYFLGKDVVLSADCVAYSFGDFHNRFLHGKTLAIACPKLDDGQDGYVDKLTSMIDHSKINSLTVITMEVPCCGGLLRIAKDASDNASRKVPIKHILIGLKGDVLSEDWV